MPKRKNARGRGRGGKSNTTSAKAKAEASEVISEKDDINKEESVIIEDRGTEKLEVEEDVVKTVSEQESVEPHEITLDAEEVKDCQEPCTKAEDAAVSSKLLEKEDISSFKPPENEERGSKTSEKEARVSKPLETEESDSPNSLVKEKSLSKTLEKEESSFPMCEGSDNLNKSDYPQTDAEIDNISKTEERTNIDDEVGVQRDVNVSSSSSNIEKFEEVEEAYMDKEEEDDVQYIDEEIEEVDEEGEQDLLDVIEMGDDENVDASHSKQEIVREAKTVTHRSPSLNKDDTKSKHNDDDGDKEDIGNTTFEEISEGSMDPMEQEEVIEAISDNEMIIESSSQGVEEEKPSGKNNSSSSFCGDETLADIFEVTENDDCKVDVQVKDKDNDDISDASLCDDDDNDDRNNLSLEEISDEELDSSKRRKSDGCSQPPALEEQNDKDETIDEGVETVSDAKAQSPVEDVVPDGENTKKRLNDEEDDSNVIAKRQKLSENGDSTDQNQDEAGKTTSVVTTQSDKDKTQQIDTPSSKSVEEVKSLQKPPPSSSSSRFIDVSAQTQPIARRGKIVQCSISRIDSGVLGGVKEDPDAKVKSKVSGIFDKYKSHLPSSVESIFTEVASARPAEKGIYSLCLGPVTLADFGNSKFRDVCLGLAEKFNLTFNSKMQGLLQAQFSKHVEVNRVIHNLKSLDLGIRYMILSLVYNTCQEDTPQHWQALLVFTYKQDDFPMTWGDTNDGKVRSRLIINGVPGSVSKDFVQLLFPEALYISAAPVQEKSARTLTLGFSSTRISKEISSCYELLLFNGEKVEITSTDPVFTTETLNVTGFIEEDGTVVVQDTDEGDEVPSSCQVEVEENTNKTNESEEEKIAHVDKVAEKNSNETNAGEIKDGRDKGDGEGHGHLDSSKNEDLATVSEVIGKNEEIIVSNESVENDKKKKDPSEGQNKEEGEEKEEENKEEEKMKEEKFGQERTKDVGTEKSVHSSILEIDDNGEEKNVTCEKSGDEQNSAIIAADTDTSLDRNEEHRDTSITGDQDQLKEESGRETALVDGSKQRSDESLTEKESLKDVDLNEGDVSKDDVLESSRTEGLDKNLDEGKSCGDVESNAASSEKKTEDDSMEMQEKTVEIDEVVKSGGDDAAEKEKGKEDLGQTEEGEREQSKSKERKNDSGKDTVLEDVSDDEMISTDVKAAESDDDDDIIILEEVPSKKIIANIDLTEEDLESKVKGEEKSSQGGNEECDDKNVPIKEEDLIDVDKLTMTDGDFEVVLESIDVEEKETEYKSVLYLRSGDYRGKYYNTNYKRDIAMKYYRNQVWTNKRYSKQRPQQNTSSSMQMTQTHGTHSREPYTRREPPPSMREHNVRKQPSPEFSYSRVYGQPESEMRVESHRNYEKLSSIHSGSSLDDKYGDSSRHHVPSREQTTFRRDAAHKRDHRRSKSASPRRDVILDRPTDSTPYQHSTPSFSASNNNKQQSYNYSNAVRAYHPYGRDHRQANPSPPVRQPSHHQPSYYDYKNNRSAPDEYNSSRSRPSNSKYETASNWGRDEYRSQKPPPQTQSRRHRSRSRSFSPLSSMSVSSSEVLLRTSPPQKLRRVSHSPISASSRSLSPISKSPSPQPRRHYKSDKYRSPPPKAYRDRYSPVSSRDLNTGRISSGQHHRSRSPSPYKSWDNRDRRRSRSPQFRRRPALSPSPPSRDTVQIHDKKVSSSAFKRASHESRSIELRKRGTPQGDKPSGLYENKIKTLYDNKNSVYKKTSAAAASSISKGSGNQQGKQQQQGDGGKSSYNSQSGAAIYGTTSTSAVNYSVPQPSNMATSQQPHAQNYAANPNYLSMPPQATMLYPTNPSMYQQYNVGGMNTFPPAYYPGQQQQQQQSAGHAMMYSFVHSATGPMQQPHAANSGNPYAQYSAAQQQAAMSNAALSNSLSGNTSGMASGMKRDHLSQSSSAMSSKPGTHSQGDNKKQNWSMGDGGTTLMFQRILSNTKSKK